MSQRVITVMRDYKGMVIERDLLAQEIGNFTGMSDTEMIEAMCFHQPDGERVQVTQNHDRTERIALGYAQRLERTNREWLLCLRNRYEVLCEEISFIENAIRSLPEDQAELMWDILIAEMTWDEIADKHNISRSTLGYKRKKALEILNRLYYGRDRLYAEYVVG